MEAMLYIHVPFCRSRCIYCDFYSTTHGAAHRAAYVEALCREMEQRAEEIGHTPLRSVYFGGGTPSQLSPAELERILNVVSRCYSLTSATELTLEANPDDVTPQTAAAWAAMGFGRVSLGVQTFSDPLLRLLRRRHDSRQACAAVETLHRCGISNLSVDLIYGLPQQSLPLFRADLRQALSLPVTHLSAYCLMVSSGTPLARAVAEGRLRPADEDLVLAHYKALVEATRSQGFEHYELSNFSRPGYASRHNTGYWDGTLYLGFGPGAHSYAPPRSASEADGAGWGTRRANDADLTAYLRADGCPSFSEETLTKEAAFNETVFTALRTRAGLPLAPLTARFGRPWVDSLLREAEPHLRAGRLSLRAGCLALTAEAVMVSDTVMADLMRAE